MKRRFKLISLLLIALIFMVSCNQKQDSGVVILYGKATLNPGSHLRLVRIDTASYVTIDSVKPGKDGSFRLAFKPVLAGIYLLKAEEETLAPVVLHPGDSVKIIIHEDSIQIKGGREAGFFDRFRQTLRADAEVADSLGAVLLLARDMDNYPDIKRTTDSAWSVLMAKARERGMRFIGEHKDFLSQILVINSKVQQAFLFDEVTDSLQLFLADSLLMASHAGNPHVKAYHNRIQLLRLTNAEESRARESMKPGKAVPFLALPGIGGKTVAMNAANNFLTLVYFWSPTDGPSRKANRELKTIYEQYKPKGLEVYAISFDQYPDRWKAAVNLDKLWWINVNEANAMNSGVARDWFVKILPVFVLIDRQGKIVDRFSTVSALEKRLAEELGQ